MTPSTSITWHYLAPNPKSCYKQLYVKGTRIRARVLYGWYACAEPMTPEAIAREFNLPVKAVLEAIAYCEENRDFLQAERERQIAQSKEYFKKYPPLMPPEYVGEE